MAKFIDAEATAAVARTKASTTTDERKRAIFEELAELMVQLPAADVAPVRHGKWLNPHHTSYVKCSLCGGTVLTNWRGFFCQNYGAKMDGGDGT